MAKKEEGSALDNFPKKLAKFLPDTFKDSVEGMSEEDLRKVIVDSSTTISEIEKDRDNDEKLNILKDDLKVLNSGYMELIKTQDAKRVYAVLTLKDRGLL